MARDNDVDMSKFDPKGRAPMTEVKGDIIEHAKTDLRVFVERCIENYDHVFGIDGVGRDCDFATPTQIARLYELEHPKSSASGVEVGRILGEHKDRVAALDRFARRPQGSSRSMRSGTSTAGATPRSRKGRPLGRATAASGSARGTPPR